MVSTLMVSEENHRINPTTMLNRLSAVSSTQSSSKGGGGGVTGKREATEETQ